MQQGVSFTRLCSLHFAQLLKIIDIDALIDSLLHHGGHDITMKFPKEFSSCIHILADHNVRIVVDDHTVDVVICANGQTAVALVEAKTRKTVKRHCL